MAVQTSFPGIYIDEFAPGAPIQGVGTGTAAFIGPAERGTLDEPTRVTTWEAFRERFGDRPVQGFYLWHAVRGFFENGGRVCYVVRASNGTYDTLDLVDGNGNATLRVRSEHPPQPGALPASVALARTNVISNVTVYQPAAVNVVGAVSLQELQLPSAAAAARFRPGDEITLVGGAARARVSRVTQDRLFLLTPLTGAAAGAQIRFADLIPGNRTIRLEPPGPAPGTLPTIQTPANQTVSALTAGTILTLSQGGSTDTLVVESVQTENFDDGAPHRTFRVTLREGLHTTFQMDGANSIDVVSEEFSFTVDDGVPQTFVELGFDPDHPRHFVPILNDDPHVPVRLIVIDPPPPGHPGPEPTGCHGGYAPRSW